MSLTTFWLEHVCYLTQLRHHHHRMYVPTSNTASHDNHMKINLHVWAFFFTLIWVWGFAWWPLGCRCSTIRIAAFFFLLVGHKTYPCITKVEVDGFGMTNVKNTIRFWRKSCLHLCHHGENKNSNICTSASILSIIKMHTWFVHRAVFI